MSLFSTTDTILKFFFFILFHSNKDINDPMPIKICYCRFFFLVCLLSTINIEIYFSSSNRMIIIIIIIDQTRYLLLLLLFNQFLFFFSHNQRNKKNRLKIREWMLDVYVWFDQTRVTLMMMMMIITSNQQIEISIANQSCK